MSSESHQRHKPVLSLLEARLGSSMSARRNNGQNVSLKQAEATSIRSNQLPQPGTLLVGRDKEIAEVSELLLSEQVQLVTLTGPAGSGKTRLGLAVAEHVLNEFSQGVYFISLSALNNYRQVIPLIAETLELSYASTIGYPCVQTQFEVLKNYLQSRRLLLVLDSFEQVAEAASQINDLLAAAPGLKIMVTSRACLRIRGEYEYKVHPLVVPEDPEKVSFEELILNPSVELFVQCSRSVKPDFMLTPTNYLAVARICALLDGLPMAIELAATHSKLLSPQEMLQRLVSSETGRLELLKDASPSLMERQQTLRETLDWSYNLLSQQEQAAFARLSVFMGGCTLQAAVAVCGTDVLDSITVLVDNSLLCQSQGASGETRLSMLQTTREYALDRLNNRGEKAVAELNFANYYVTLATEAERHLSGSQQGYWLARLEEEHENLMAVILWSQHQPNYIELGLRLAGALESFWEIHGHLSEGREVIQSLLSHPASFYLKSSRARVLLASGRLAYLQGDYSGSLSRFMDGLELYREVEDLSGKAKALSSMGLVALRQGNYDQTHLYCSQSLEINRELHALSGIADDLNNLGLASWFQGEYNSARELYEESLKLREQTGDMRGTAITLSNLGAVAFHQGDYANAQRYQEEALASWKEMGDRAGMAHGLQHLGLLASGKGELEQARSLQEESLRIRNILGDRWGIARSLTNLGWIIAREGNIAEGEEMLQKALLLRQSLGDRWGQADTLTNLGQVAIWNKDYQSAQSYYRQALKLASSLGLNLQLALCLEGLGLLAVQQSQTERAARLWSAACALRQRTGAVILQCDRDQYEEQLSSVRHQLSITTFTRVWQEGQTLKDEGLVNYAFRNEP
ncbi:MAG TPA: tetratricopeptide repeat protein [Chloroflexia bacterium]|nr:tetratricopeptide repeat protein [Chloroflexia bacterium]